MGHSYDIPLTPGTCVYVPTGGAVPPDADAMVMLEYTEDLGGDQFAFYKPVAPGANLILRGEDLRLSSNLARKSEWRILALWLHSERPKCQFFPNPSWVSSPLATNSSRQAKA